MDWGVHAYDPTGTNGVDPRNGGIVGSISYDTTRNELDPQYAAAEDWQPGVPDVPVKLYATVDCPGPTPARRATLTEPTSSPPTAPTSAGKLLNTYLSETWEQPTGCTARDVDGGPARPRRRRGRAGPEPGDRRRVHPAPSPRACSSAPYADRPGHSGRQLRCRRQRQLRLRRRLLRRDARRHRPGQPGLQRRHSSTRSPRPTTTWSRRRSQTTQTGDADVQGDRRGGHQHRRRRPDRPAGAAAVLRRCAAHRRRRRRRHRRLPGGRRERHQRRARRRHGARLDPGGQPHLRSTSAARPTRAPPKPRCDTKLVDLNNGKSVVPMFNVFTDVPLPVAAARPDHRRRQLLRRPAGPRCTARRPACRSPRSASTTSPTGWCTTVESDYNGIYDVLMPSTNHISCPTPVGRLRQHVPVRRQRPGRARAR